MDTKFTVLLAVYANDDSEQLQFCLDSVYANTAKPSEVLLVVDGPIPIDIKLVINKYVILNHLNVIYLKSNRGLFYALNAGLAQAENELIFRIDPDDFCKIDRFERQLKVINNGFDLCGGVIAEVDNKGVTLGLRIVPTSKDDILKFIKYRNPFNHVSVAFRKTFALECGGYPNVYLREDYALWVAMITKGARVFNSNEIYSFARVDNGLMQRRGGFKYACGEILLQKQLLSSGLTNLGFALAVGMMRFLVFVIPSGIRSFIYKFFLRDRSE